MYTEKLEMQTGYTFDDVLLIPAASSVEPNQVNVKSRFSKNINLSIPLVSAAMDTVTTSTMAIALARAGSIGVIHRNMTPEREVEEVKLVKRAGDFIERDVLTVSSDATVADVHYLMRERNIGGLPVLENNKIVGIVSRRDLRGIMPARASDN
ncbi:MAG: IMP dehydrogenase, partial [Methanomicrobium sp.]|nr:IMP dehydrogenase [Methanomicrobium sp.]